MSCGGQHLLGSIIALVDARPGYTLARISRMLGVHPHTASGRLASAGKDIRSLRDQSLLRLLDRCLGAGEPFKQAWTSAGFRSASEFARRVRRLTDKSPSELRRMRDSGSIAANLAGLGLDVLGAGQ